MFKPNSLNFLSFAELKKLGITTLRYVTLYRIDIVKKNIEILIYRYRFDIVSISAKRRRCCLFIFFFVGNKSRTARIMTLKRSLARRPNRNSTMLGLKLKYRPLYNSLN